MKELIQSIFDSSTERIKSPLVGSYITAFLIYNWRPVLIILFSDLQMENKIELINNTYCLLSSFLWPLAISLFYVLILPWLNYLIEKALFGLTRSKSIKKHESKLFLLHQKKDEVRAEKELEDIRAGLQDVVNLNNQIEQLKEEKQKLIDENLGQINSHNEIVKNLKNNYETKLEEFSDSSQKLENEAEFHRASLSKAVALSNVLSKKELDNFVENSKNLIKNGSSISSQLQNALEKYIELGLINKLTSKRNTIIYELTQTGLSLFNLQQRLNELK